MAPAVVEQVCPERWFRLAKRMIDIAGALAGLAGLAIISPVISAAILLESGRPIFFRQTRMGRGGQLFTLYKFRTMQLEAERDGNARWASVGDVRATRVGHWLRRSHLDEAPQFWNVLQGDMSLIGPRPERPEFYTLLEKDVPFYRARLLVKPGISGWAQVNYRYTNSVDDTATKLQFDLFYIQHQSVWLDLAILVRTLGVVLSFQGT